MQDEKRPAATSNDDEAERRRVEQLLDEALADTFPASDPVAIGRGKRASDADRAASQPGRRKKNARSGRDQ